MSNTLKNRSWQIFMTGEFSERMFMPSGKIRIYDIWVSYKYEYGEIYLGFMINSLNLWLILINNIHIVALVKLSQNWGFLSTFQINKK